MGEIDVYKQVKFISNFTLGEEKIDKTKYEVFALMRQ